MKQNKKISKTPLLIVRKLLVIIGFISIGFTFGYVLGFRGYSTSLNRFPKVTINRVLPADKKTLDYSLFWRVWDTLHAKYFDQDKLIDSKMVYGAIRGMVAAVEDPYTVFLPPSENKVVQEDLNGNFEGVGIQIGFKGSQLAVIAPLPGSPAEKAGIKAGDLIIGLTDEKKGIDMGTFGITLPEAVQIIRGPANTKITLLIVREGLDEPLEIEVTRKNINIPSIVVDYVGETQDIAHVQILKFSAETLDEWEEAVIELLKKPEIKGIVMDVRNNPGGFLQGAVELASDFLETGEVVVMEEDGRGSKQEFRVEKLGRFRSKKVIVLVNEGSASASEIFAGALRDGREVELVGETTFGKGTIQEPQQIDNGAGLHITIARWLTPSGYWVNEGGLVPDHELEDDPETDEDEQLQKAIEILR